MALTHSTPYPAGADRSALRVRINDAMQNVTRGGDAVATLERDSLGFYHPTSEDDIVQLVQRASRDGVPMRVRGAAHSLPQGGDPCPLSCAQPYFPARRGGQEE
jgi:hypothetical protein